MVTPVLDSSVVDQIHLQDEHLLTEPRSHSSQNFQILNSTFADLLAGSVAGVAGKVVEYPFDTIKVRLQCQEVSSKGRVMTTSECFRNLIRYEGFRGLFRGMSAPMVGSVMENCILFVTYGRVRRMLANNVDEEKGMEGMFAVMGAGAVAGTTTSLVVTPVELVKCRLQTDTSRVFRGPLHCALATLRAYGLRGLYRGHAATFARESVGGIAWFGTYEFTCRKLSPDGKKDSLAIPYLLFAGALSGIAYNTVLFPADVVKSQIQSDPTGDKSYIRRLKKLYVNEGVRGLYRGYGITFIRAIPANAIILGSYEIAYRGLMQF